MWAGKQIKDANRSHERKMLMLDHIHPFYNPADKLKKKKSLLYLCFFEAKTKLKE